MAQAAVKIEFEDISISEIAKRCKLDRATVKSRLDDLGYEPVLVEAKLTLYRFSEEVKFALLSAKDSISAAKLRDLRATYELKELKLAEARGELVERTEMTVLVQSIVGAIYQEYTVRQPKRIAMKLAKAKNLIEVKKVLKADSDRIMKMLKSNFAAFIDQK